MTTPAIVPAPAGGPKVPARGSSPGPDTEHPAQPFAALVAALLGSTAPGVGGHAGHSGEPATGQGQPRGAADPGHIGPPPATGHPVSDGAAAIAAGDAPASNAAGHPTPNDEMTKVGSLDPAAIAADTARAAATVAAPAHPDDADVPGSSSPVRPGTPPSPGPHPAQPSGPPAGFPGAPASERSSAGWVFTAGAVPPGHAEAEHRPSTTAPGQPGAPAEPMPPGRPDGARALPATVAPTDPSAAGPGRSGAVPPDVGVIVAPASTATPAATTAASVPTAAHPPTTAAQLATPVLAVHNRGAEGSHVLSVSITPEELGPVRLEIELRDGQVELRMAGSGDAARDALRAALPELRRSLEAAGLQTGALQVSAEDAPGPGSGDTPAHSDADRPGTGRRDGRGTHPHADPAQAAAAGRPATDRPPAAATRAGALDLHL